MKRLGLAIIALALALPSSGWAKEPTWIPLGDGRLSTTEGKVGSLYSCTTVSGGGGARAAGAWIVDGKWSPDLKPSVAGAVTWPTARLSLNTTTKVRTISTTGVPVGATTGTFPIAASDPAYQYDTNPNTIRATTMKIEIPRYPSIATSATCLPLGPIGYALNGVAIFNGIDGEGRDAVAHEIQDSCSGHPERTGMYHYHSGSKCIAAKAKGTSVLIGYALDGFGIYRETGAKGRALTNADLDACHGRTSTVTFNGKSQRIYHYVVTAEYPYTLGCFKGTPLATTLRALSEVTTTGAPPPRRP
jgi:hypothetical protein